VALAGAVTAPLTRWRFRLGVDAGFLLLLWSLNDILLIAVPVAAIVGVVVRHLLGRYHASSFYRGGVSG
jgi:hypothetical protein